jgi:hypothetical protein
MEMLKATTIGKERPMSEEDKMLQGHAVLLKAILETQGKVEGTGHAVMREITTHVAALKEACYKIELLHHLLMTKPRVKRTAQKKIKKRKKNR